MTHRMGFSVIISTTELGGEPVVEVNCMTLAPTRRAYQEVEGRELTDHVGYYSIEPQGDQDFYHLMEAMGRVVPGGMLGPLTRLVRMGVEVGITHERQRAEKRSQQ